MGNIFYIFLEGEDKNNAEYDIHQIGTVSFNTLYCSQGFERLQKIINEDSDILPEAVSIFDSKGKKYTISEFLDYMLKNNIKLV